MEIGQYNILKVLRKTDNGLYLIDEAGEEVLLPKKFVSSKMKEGTLGRVFIYKDSKDRLVATTQHPYAIAGQAACLVVKDVAGIGAFLDWGLEKDLLLPFSEQPVHVRKGDLVLVYVYLDRATGRVVASSNMNKFIKNRELSFEENTEVDLLVGDETDIGFKVVINQKHWGMLYRNEIFGEVKKGMHLKGYIKKVREDNKIDVALQKQGLDAALDFGKLIVGKLTANGGFLPLTDHSSPEEIYATLGISKKNFKKAIGMLYKKKLIAIQPDGIALIDLGE